MATIDSLFPHQTLRQLPEGSPRRIACFTLDFELDYGTRTGELRILDREEDITRLKDALRQERLPLSLFVVTGLLDRFPKSLAAARFLGDDWHCHSHAHEDAPGEAGIARTAETFRRHFGRPASGYRAPQGRLRPEDVPQLAGHGFRFSSSVFPSWRPGKYNHLRRPLRPMRYDNGLFELPLAAIPGLRVPLCASYLKLLGSSLSRLCFGAFGLPDILVMGSHLHDLITEPRSLAQLPRPIRAVYGIRRDQGLDGILTLGRHLRAEGYSFLTMTELCELCARGSYG